MMESRRTYGSTGIGFSGESASKPIRDRYSMGYFWFSFTGVEKGVCTAVEFKAKNRENATRNAKRFAKDMGYGFEKEITFGEYCKRRHPGR